jgi:hypothetical protein
MDEDREDPPIEVKKSKRRRTRKVAEEPPPEPTPLEAKNNCLEGIMNSIGGQGRPKVVITYEPTQDASSNKSFEHEPSDTPNVVLDEAPPVLQDSSPESNVVEDPPRSNKLDREPEEESTVGCKHPLKNGPCGKKIYACGYCSKHYEKHVEDDEEVAAQALSKGGETLFIAEYGVFGLADKLLLSRGYIPNNDTLATKFFNDRERFIALNADLVAKYGASETIKYLSDPAYTLPAAMLIMVLGHLADTHFEDVKTEQGKEKIMNKAKEEGYIDPAPPAYDEDEFLPGI